MTALRESAAAAHAAAQEAAAKAQRERDETHARLLVERVAQRYGIEVDAADVEPLEFRRRFPGADKYPPQRFPSIDMGEGVVVRLVGIDYSHDRALEVEVGEQWVKADSLATLHAALNAPPPARPAPAPERDAAQELVAALDALGVVSALADELVERMAP